MKNLILGAILISMLSSCASATQSNCINRDVAIEHENFTVFFTVKSSQEKVSDKALIIMPPTGGSNYIDRSYAKQFCAAGYDTYIINGWTGMYASSVDLHIHDVLYERGQYAIKLVSEYIRSPFLGLLGTSVGGLHAAVAANNYERINAVFVIAAGVPIAEVIVNSNQKEMQQLYTKRQKVYQFKNREENLQALKKNFNYEPIGLSDKYLHKDLGMSIALEDKTVPTENQLKLKDYWNPETVITHPSTHFWGIVKTWLFDSEQIIQFFDRSAARLATPRTHPALKTEPIKMQADGAVHETTPKKEPLWKPVLNRSTTI